MLTDFQNYFATEKGIKFPTNPAIFHQSYLEHVPALPWGS